MLTLIRPDFLRELRRIAALALSLALVHLGFHLTGFVDTIFAGRIGGETLAATGLGTGLFFAFSVFGIGAVMGLDPIIAQYVGAGELSNARKAMWQGFYAAALMCFPLTLIITAIGFSLPAFGVGASLSGKTLLYILGRLPSLWFLLAGVAMRAYFQAQHKILPIFIAVLITNIVNFLADWLFLFGDSGLVGLGLPPIGLKGYGVSGLAWASTLATVVQLGILIVAIKPARKLHFNRPDQNVLRKIFRVGSPLGLQLLAETAVFALVGLLMGRLGTAAMASHQIAIQIASLTFAVALGIGAATSVQVGRAIGRQDQTATRNAGIAGISLGASFMLLMGILMWSAPEFLARFMTSDSQVIPVAVNLITIAAFFQVADGVQTVGAGALRGAGVTRWTLGANLVGHWLLGLPCGLFLAFKLELGPAGLWWGLTVGLGFVALVLAGYFLWLSRRPISRLD